MKILAFGASNHSASMNGALASHAAQRLNEKLGGNAELDNLDLNAYEMPIYSLDRERANGVHELAQAFYAKITSADTLVISFPSYNGTYTSAYKNIFDWASRIDQKVFQGRPALILSTSPGAGGAREVLEAVKIAAPFQGLAVAGAFSLPSFGANFDVASGKITEPTLTGALDEQIDALIKVL